MSQSPVSSHAASSDSDSLTHTESGASPLHSREHSSGGQRRRRRRSSTQRTASPGAYRLQVGLLSVIGVLAIVGLLGGRGLYEQVRGGLSQTFSQLSGFPLFRVEVIALIIAALVLIYLMPGMEDRILVMLGLKKRSRHRHRS